MARLKIVLSLLIGLFIFYTSAFGVFESLIQRSIFLALIAILGIVLYPLGARTKWRPIGMVVDVGCAAIVATSTTYVVLNFEYIMIDRPFAETWDLWMAYATTAVILELARRAVSWLFPVLVGTGVAYALLGQYIPGAFGHRGFDLSFVAETIFLGDQGLYGMLVGIASTVLAAFVLFGAILLHTGAGQTFIDLAARAGGSRPGGAAKIATIASGLFGSVSGSSVANVATTGNFTIPLMKRLNYPPAFAGGVEAIASTGGQIAPPIMGTAAFVMAELVGVNYWLIAVAAIIPAFLFYLGVFKTVDVIAHRMNLSRVADEDLPDWRKALDWHRLAPIIAAVVGIGYGIGNGNSVQTTAFFGMIGMLGAFAIASLTSGKGVKWTARSMMYALEEGGKGVVVVGILLVAAQVFVAMLNLTGIGITFSNSILALAGHNTWLIAVIMGAVCLIAGMGLPTSAAYVLVAAVFAPALIQVGLDPLTVHFFVLFYATLSVITPPVCVGVFVASAIADAPWLKVASYAVRMGATAYMLPLLFLLYPGMLGNGGVEAIAMAICAGVVFTLANAHFFGGRPIFGKLYVDSVLWAVPIVLGILPTWLSTIAGAVVLGGLIFLARQRDRRRRVLAAVL